MAAIAASASATMIRKLNLCILNCYAIETLGWLKPSKEFALELQKGSIICRDGVHKNKSVLIVLICNHLKR